jgi:ankyrin repeat protein
VCGKMASENQEAEALADLAANGDIEALREELAFLLCHNTSEEVVQAILSCEFGGRGTKSALHVAAMRGRATVLEELLQAGAPPEATDDSGNTPLHFSVSLGHAKAAYVLLRAGASLKVKNNFGRSPEDDLETKSWDAPAIATGKEWIRLIAAGSFQGSFDDLPAEPPLGPCRGTRQTADSGAPPAARSTSVSSLRVSTVPRTSIQAVSDSYAGPFTDVAPEADTLASMSGNGAIEALKDELAYLLRHNTRVQVVQSILSCDFGDRGSKSALHTAAIRGRAAILQELLATGAPAEARDDSGNTPLHYAVGLGHAKVAFVLIQAGASFEILNNFGRSPADEVETQVWDSPEIAGGKEWIRHIQAGLFTGSIDDLPPEPPLGHCRGPRPRPQAG